MNTEKVMLFEAEFKALVVKYQALAGRSHQRGATGVSRNSAALR